MQLFKIIFLQLFWYLVLEFGQESWASYVFIPLSLSFVFIFYYIKQINIPVRKLITLLTFFIGWGLTQDFILYYSGIFQIDHFPVWLASLWIVFIIYYDDIFLKFLKFPSYLIALIGAIAGPFSYWGGVKIAGIIIPANLVIPFVLIVGVSWGAFFPLTLKMYHNKNLP